MQALGGAVALAAWTSHAAFAAADTSEVSQTMLSFLPTLAVSELSPQLLAVTLLWLARGGFGDDAAVRAAVDSLHTSGAPAMSFAQACALAARLLGLASVVPLAAMARNVLFSRRVFLKALQDAGVPAPLTARPLTMSDALAAALPFSDWLRAGIESQTSITYGRAPARVSRHVGAAASSSSPPSLDAPLKFLKLDLLWDRAALRRPAAPILMYAHGGGWVVGSRKLHSISLLLAAARAGWLVATVDYRLAPAVAFPHMLYDCKAALAWVRQHAAAYGGDPSFIAVAGESAGGHLALMLGLTPNVPAYQPPRGGGSDAPAAAAAGCDTTVQAVVDLYGVADWTDSAGAYARRWRAPGSPAGIVPFIEALVLKRRFADHTHEFVRASPLWWVHGERVSAALRAAGIEVAPSAAAASAAGAAERAQSAGAQSRGEQQSSDASNELDDVVAVEAASQLVHHGDGPTSVSAGPSGPSELIADMAVDRPVPPVLIVHGSGDTVVPHADSKLFWGALQQRRARDAAPAAPDVFVTLPGAHHAFNFIASARARALGDAVMDWLNCVHTAAAAASASDGSVTAPLRRERGGPGTAPRL